MSIERGSDQHGRRIDEQMKQESQGLVRGGGTSHAEEWKEPEPVQDAESGQRARVYPPGHEPGVAPGMTQNDVERRGDLARWLAGVHFPAGREEIVAHASGDPAVPDAVTEALRDLPDGEFANIGQMAEALGLGMERRFAE
ncbi:hypothetical protein Sru01_67650 [Sphaerisporangium rufum]|uniref:DUF2795 domain-containing protein n=1 Tax=Sphaerisporangium rufum TaxID=1381558 RepID=A0A919R9M2_9ACTN|nr:DUF2795 domain-containing protein [Sphaerisporangium rufum]GII81783.1 hypothetical protein Sru01_67650 [Sphaerisporangium rufum]